MASTSYRTRVIVKEHTDRQSDFSGTYNLLVAAKSVPSPASPPNTVESTTMEDDQQTFEKGIKTSDSREITGNLEKEYLSKVDGYGDKKLDIIHLYGTDGIGFVFHSVLETLDALTQATHQLGDLLTPKQQQHNSCNQQNLRCSDMHKSILTD